MAVVVPIIVTGMCNARTRNIIKFDDRRDEPDRCIDGTLSDITPWFSRRTARTTRKSYIDLGRHLQNILVGFEISNRKVRWVNEMMTNQHLDDIIIIVIVFLVTATTLLLVVVVVVVEYLIDKFSIVDLGLSRIVRTTP